MKAMLALLSSTFLFSGVSFAQFTREVSPGPEKGPSIEVSLDDVSWTKGLRPELRAAVQARQQKLYEEARRGAIQGMSRAAIDILGEIEIEKAIKRVQSGESPVIAFHIIPNPHTMLLSEHVKYIDDRLETLRKEMAIEVVADHRSALKVSECQLSERANDRGCLVPSLELKVSRPYGGNMLGFGKLTATCTVKMEMFFEMYIDHKSDERVKFYRGVTKLRSRPAEQGNKGEINACNAIERDLQDKLLFGDN